MEQDIQNTISEDLGDSVILWMKQQVMEIMQVMISQIHLISWIWWLRKSVLVAFIKRVHMTLMHPAENLDWSLLQNTALDTCQTCHSSRFINDSSLQSLIQNKHLNSQSWLTEPSLLRWPVEVLQVLRRQKANLDLTARHVVSWHTRDICLINTVNNNSVTTVLHCTTWARAAVQLGRNSLQPMFKSKRHGRPRRVHQVWVTTIAQFLFVVEHPGANVYLVLLDVWSTVQIGNWTSLECFVCTYMKNTKSRKCFLSVFPSEI